MKKPQTTRLQYSACGACRTRRIKCDLKDLLQDAIESGVSPVCTTCRERDLVCTYEFNHMQATKLFRRGRRIKEVEAVYGKGSSPSASPSSDSGRTSTQSAFSFAIPPAASGSGGRFRAAHSSLIPRLKPQFFTSSFFRQFHLTRPIIDPTEFPTRYFAPPPTSPSPELELLGSILYIWAYSFGADESGNEFALSDSARTRDECNGMIKDALSRVDALGILRRPTCDGMRILLLLQPLTCDVLLPMDRLVMHESTMSQVCTLCSTPTVDPSLGVYTNALVRARIFWYAYTQEGLLASQNQRKRMILSEDDLELFNSTIPSLEPHSPSYQTDASQYEFQLAYRLASIPLKISNACRNIHTALRSRLIDEQAVRENVDTLQGIWYELDRFRNRQDAALLTQEDCELFVNLWQMVIFDSYCTVRNRLRDSRASPQLSGSPLQGSLLAFITSKCLHTHPLILQHINASLCRLNSGLITGSLAHLTQLTQLDYDFQRCLEVFQGMRWCFAGSERKIQELCAERQLQTGALISPVSTFAGLRHSPSGSSESSGYASAGLPPPSVYQSGITSPTTTAFSQFNPTAVAMPYTTAHSSRAGSSSSSSSNTSEPVQQRDWMAGDYITPASSTKQHYYSTDANIHGYSLNDGQVSMGMSGMTSSSYGPPPTYGSSQNPGSNYSPPGIYVSTTPPSRTTPPSQINATTQKSPGSDYSSYAESHRPAMYSSDTSPMSASTQNQNSPATLSPWIANSYSGHSQYNSNHSF